MRIKYLAGPKIGTMEHVVNEVGRALTATGLAEEVRAATLQERVAEAEAARRANPITVRWELVAHPFIGLRYSSGEAADTDGKKRTQYSPTYFGNPDNVNAKRVWPGGENYVVFGRRVPDEWVESYRDAWKKNKNQRAPQAPDTLDLSEQQRLQNENAERENLLRRLRAADAFAATVKDCG
jgi:hypothetical protein